MDRLKNGEGGRVAVREINSNSHLWPRWNNKVQIHPPDCKKKMDKIYKMVLKTPDIRKQKKVIPITKEVSPVVEFSGSSTEKGTSQIPKDSMS